MEKIVITFATAKSGASPYLDFNSPQAAVIEITTGPMQGLLFIDTQEEEPGYFINFLTIEEDTGHAHQWVAIDGEMYYPDAIGALATMAMQVGEHEFFRWMADRTRRLA
jgi:hypothetical protein